MRVGLYTLPKIKDVSTREMVLLHRRLLSGENPPIPKPLRTYRKYNKERGVAGIAAKILGIWETDILLLWIVNHLKVRAKREALFCPVSRQALRAIADDCMQVILSSETEMVVAPEAVMDNGKIVVVQRERLIIKDPSVAKELLPTNSESDEVYNDDYIGEVEHILTCCETALERCKPELEFLIFSSLPENR